MSPFKEKKEHHQRDGLNFGNTNNGTTLNKDENQFMNSGNDSDKASAHRGEHAQLDRDQAGISTADGLRMAQGAQVNPGGYDPAETRPARRNYTVSQVPLPPFTKLANPGPLGLLSFALTTFVLGLYECGAGYVCILYDPVMSPQQSS